MSYSDLITTIGIIVSFLGVIVTGVFTWKVWKATQETAKATQAAANTAQATLKLNEDLAKREEIREKEFIRAMKMQLSPRILTESELALNAIVNTDPLKILGKLKDAPQELSIDRNEIAKYFSSEEIEAITNAWISYEEFRTKYSSKNKLNPGEDRELLNNSKPVVSYLDNLIHLLKYPEQ